MKTFKKNYIGKGTQVKNFDIVRVTLKMEDLQKCVHEYEGQEYATFEIARMQTPDNYNRTHTVYFQTVEETEDKPKKSSRRKPKKQMAN